MTPKEKAMKKTDFEILFKDSPEYYSVLNAKMIIEGSFVRFLCFIENTFSHDEWYPVQHIHRIKGYPK